MVQHDKCTIKKKNTAGLLNRFDQATDLKSPFKGYLVVFVATCLVTRTKPLNQRFSKLKWQTFDQKQIENNCACS